MTPENQFGARTTHYSELTGWYWIWKNLRDVNVLGLCHYRRYFLFDNKRFLFFRRRKRYFYPTPSYFNYITAPERTAFVEKALSKYDVIIPQRIPLDASLSQNYANCHVREDWDLFIQGIEALYPQYSSEIGWFDKTSYIHPYNMMVAPRGVFRQLYVVAFSSSLLDGEKTAFSDRSVSMPGSRVSIRTILYLLFARNWCELR